MKQKIIFKLNQDLVTLSTNPLLVEDAHFQSNLMKRSNLHYPLGYMFVKYNLGLTLLLQRFPYLQESKTGLLKEDNHSLCMSNKTE